MPHRHRGAATASPIITIGGDLRFSGTGTASWTGGEYLQIRCTQDGSTGIDLDVTLRGGTGSFQLGPTPTWASGGAIGHAYIRDFADGSFTDPLGDATFTVDP